MPPEANTQDKALTAATSTALSPSDAAKLVYRETIQLVDGKPTGKTIKTKIEPVEVFAFRDYGDHVVVVTVDGQKFTGAKKADK